MDAVKFLEERVRMCEHDIYNSDCDYESLVETVKTLAKAVEMWAAEYPRKTRQDVFLEQWPDAELDADGVLEISPCSLSKSMKRMAVAAMTEQKVAEIVATNFGWRR